MILSTEKLVIGREKVIFVGNKMDGHGLNMTEPRIASAIAFKTTESLNELTSFLGLMNYSRDHIRNYSTHAHHLHEMVSGVNKQIVMMVTWTSAGRGVQNT